MPDPAMVIYIVHQLQKAGFKSADLKDLVHDTASVLATEANRGGLTGQVKYLLQAELTPDDIKQWLHS